MAKTKDQHNHCENNMKNTDSIVKAIRKDMAKLKPPPGQNSTRKIIDNLVDDIHRNLKNGMHLADVYHVIRQHLPADTRLSLGTFKQYWRDARDAAGLPKIKNSGPRKSSQTSSQNPDVKKIIPREYNKSNLDNDTSGDFRVDPEDI